MAVSKRRRNKALERKMARDHIARLFQLAEREALNSRQDRADRYVFLARRIAMRYNIGLGHYRRYFCRKCGTFLVPGRNSTYRLSHGKITITCRNCGQIFRFPYHVRSDNTMRIDEGEKKEVKK